MSDDDGFSDNFDEPDMEIQIKTLMGTTFDIKVTSTQTIGDIKRKIYRVEEIPIYQQNLLYQSKELSDTSRLCDAGIKNGSILTLVTTMRGGPISTRRLSIACEHHVVLKELKELLENTREEIGDKLASGSKVSVLVFKEGDIINLLRVVENEDGSYSPYGNSDKSITPPTKPNRKEGNIFERLVEENDMSTKIATLRAQMNTLSIRRQARHRVSVPKGRKTVPLPPPPPLTFKFLTDCANDLLDTDINIVERSLEDESHSETEEIALKDKHRSKQNKIPFKSKYSESKGIYSHVKQNYARIHRRTRDLKASDAAGSSTEDATVSRNRLQLARLVLSESGERPKSSQDSVEVEENQSVWELPKHSATCKVGLVKHRQSYDYGYDSDLDGASNVNHPELSGGGGGNFSDFEVCSSNFYHMPQFMTTTSPTTTATSPSAIPPQYAPKEHYYFHNNARSPLYGRKTKEGEEGDEKETSMTTHLPEIKSSFLSPCLSGGGPIGERLNQECLSDGEESGVFASGMDDLYGYYNLGCSSDLLGERVVVPTLLTTAAAAKPDAIGKSFQLPPVIKKKSRCSECNKRLNITNIYDCRCGKIFCAQHRYSEVHHCNYDYKTEGRRLLEQQNPLVQAEKLNKI